MFVNSHKGKFAITSEGNLLEFALKGKSLEAYNINIPGKGFTLHSAQHFGTQSLLRISDDQGVHKVLIGNVIDSNAASKSITLKEKIQKMKVITKYNMAVVCCDSNEGSEVMLVNIKTG